jgi:hypothetical protein
MPGSSCLYINKLADVEADVPRKCLIQCNRSEIMRTPGIPAFLLVALFLLISLSACTDAEPPATWYKGNLHTHSFWSDGDDFPESIAQWYADNGYDFLAISDHNTMAADTARWMDVDASKRPIFNQYVAAFGEDWVDTRQVDTTLQVRLKTFAEYRSRFSDHMLIIQSEEISDRFERKPIHVNATNLQEYIHPAGRDAEESGSPLGSVVEVMQANVDRVLEQRERLGIPMFPHINHPNFGWAILAEELAVLDGERFFEVYNGHPLVNNGGDSLRMGTERMWDVVNTIRVRDGRPLMFGLAVDDAHNYHEISMDRANVGRGWVMVRASERSTAALLAAMENGAFYGTTGVELADVRVGGGLYTVEIKPEEGVSYRIEFIGTRKDHEPGTESVYDADGNLLTTTFSQDIGIILESVEDVSATYAFDGSEMFVRARIVSDVPKNNPNHEGEVEMAWTQPVLADSVN